MKAALCFFIGLFLSLWGPVAFADVEQKVLVIRVDQVLKESLAAQVVEVKIETLRQQYKAEFDQQSQSLRLAEQELVEQEKQGDTPEYRDNVVAFEERVRVMRRLAQERGKALQQISKEAMDTIRAKLMPLLGELMDKYNATVMLDERQVILSAKNIDVTQEAIERLNKTVKAVDIAIPSDNIHEQPL